MTADDDYPTTHTEWIARGKRIAESGKYALKRGELLGRLQSLGLDVYENSPQSWKDALFAEWDQAKRNDGNGAD
jgi:hypothetical protein